jgi:hypothetical protein
MEEVKQRRYVTRQKNGYGIKEDNSISQNGAISPYSHFCMISPSGKNLTVRSQ